MRIIGWTKEGWSPRLATEEDHTRHKAVRPAYNSVSGSFQSNHTDEFTLFNRISENIQTGIPQEAIDALPPNLRMLYETDGRFFVGNYGVLRKVDEIEQALDYQDWGLDSGDLEEKDQNLSDEGTALETMHQEQQRLADVIICHYESLIEEAEKTDNLIAREILVDECAAELLLIPSDKNFMYSLNSRFTALGFAGPKQMVQAADKSRFNEMSEAAQQRRVTFERLFTELGFCKKKTQIYGVPKKEGKETIWEGGFFSHAREDYFKDKAIVVKWSQEAKEEARFKLIKEWRASDNPMHDEETLRQELYWRFDREQTTTPAQFSTGNDGKKKLLKDERRTKPSKWDNDKSRAYLEMSMTMGQWKAIYQLKDILIHKIDINYRKDNDCEAALQVLREDYDSIQTIDDLAQYISMAQNRKWLTRPSIVATYQDVAKCKGELIPVTRHKTIQVPTNVFEPSLIDRISTGDEFRWKRSVRDLAKELTAKEKKKE